MKNNFIQRVATSAIFVIVLVGASLLHQFSLFILFSGIVVIGQIEFYKIAVKNRNKPQILPGIVFGMVLYTVNFLVVSKTTDPELFAIFVPFFVLIMIIELYRKSKNPFANIAFTTFGAIYVAIPFGITGYFVYHPAYGSGYNPSILIAFFLMIWASDSGAYIIGSLIGKHKLFESISPKKTWEGFMGGVLFSVIAAFIISLILKELSMLTWIIISLITSVFGTFGDLTESLLKRKVNVKDSGHILPGHGGILDRFDSLLFASPIVFLYLVFFS